MTIWGSGCRPWQNPKYAVCGPRRWRGSAWRQRQERCGLPFPRPPNGRCQRDGGGRRDDGQGRRNQGKTRWIRILIVNRGF